MRFIIIVLIAYILYHFLKDLLGPRRKQEYQQQPLQKRQTTGGEDLVEDPNCHTYIPLSDAYKASAYGKIYYFCSRKCIDEFKLNEEKGKRAEAP